MDDQVLVSANDLARLWRVPRYWLIREAEAGRLPSIEAGSQRLFNKAVIEALLAERAGGPIAQRGEGARDPSGRARTGGGA
jgi:hypothetical protein